MWAGGHQQPSANAQQWWQMSYNYQYHTQSADSSQDWAAKAALWAQQRMAQEQMAQYYQQLPPADQQQPAMYGGYKAEQPVGVAQQPTVSAESQQHYYQPAVPEEVPPPLPPETESEPPIPGWQAQDNHQVTDNMETIAMDDEAAENNSSQIEADKGQPSAPHGEEMGQTAFMQDYNHQPPPALPGMQTFDHNHGFRRPIPQHYVSSAAAQPIDYGHQSLDYHHEAPLVPDTQVYDYQAPYDNQYYHQMPYEMERSHPKLAPEPFKSKPPPSADFPPELSGLSDVKRKALPLWIREGLEKLEKQKQKKNEEENEQKKSALNLSGSSTSIAGYDHGKVDSPVQSPNINNADEGNDEEDGNPQLSEGESDKSESEGPRGKGRKTKVVLPSHKRRHSSDEEDEEKTEEERQQELMVNIRKLLTEVLLTVTTEEMRGIAQEMYNEALKGPAQQLRHSGGLDALRGKGGFLGLGGYGSGSESETEENSAGERLYAAEDERKHRSADIDREERSQRSRSRTQADKHDSARESDEDHSETHKPSYRHSRKQRRHRSPSSSYDESSSSASTHEKSRRKKHRRRDKSASSSPKRRSKHRRRHGRKSRSKSRSPRKHKSSKKKRRSETESDSDSESRTPSKRRSSKHSGREYSPKEKKHKRRRRSPSSSPRYEKEGKKDRKR